MLGEGAISSSESPAPSTLGVPERGSGNCVPHPDTPGRRLVIPQVLDRIPAA